MDNPEEIIWLFNLIMSVPDEGYAKALLTINIPDEIYSRMAPCTLISRSAF
jgi:hypothetical protein